MKNSCSAQFHWSLVSQKFRVFVFTIAESHSAEKWNNWHQRGEPPPSGREEISMRSSFAEHHTINYSERMVWVVWIISLSFYQPLTHTQLSAVNTLAPLVTIRLPNRGDDIAAVAVVCCRLWHSIVRWRRRRQLTGWSIACRVMATRKIIRVTMHRQISRNNKTHHNPNNRAQLFPAVISSMLLIIK